MWKGDGIWGDLGMAKKIMGFSSVPRFLSHTKFHSLHQKNKISLDLMANFSTATNTYFQLLPYPGDKPIESSNRSSIG